MKPVSKLKALVILILSVAIVPIVDTIAKLLTSTLTPSFLVCSRYLVSFLIALLVFQAPARAYISFCGAKFLHVSRSAILMLSMICFFWSISRIPIAIALGGYFTGPIIATLLSCPFLKEPFSLRNVVSIGFCFMGIMLIINPENLDVHSVFLSIISGFLYGIYIVLTRSSSILVREEDNLLIQSFFGFLLSFPLIFKDYFPIQQVSLSGLFFIFLIGFLSFLSHAFSLISFKVLDVKTAAPFLYFEIVFSAVLGLIVFDDFPSLYSWIGILLIILGGIYNLKTEKDVIKSKWVDN